MIDDWTDHPPTEVSNTVAMYAGSQPTIRIEYYENYGGAVAQLSWSSASQPKQIVPAGRLVLPGLSNLPPIATPDVKTVLRGGGASIALLTNDSDPDGALDSTSVLIVSSPIHGTVSVSPLTGVATYTHTGGASDTGDSFSYTVKDGAGAVSEPATVSIALVAPPQVVITSPAAGQVVIGTAVTLAYGVSGYSPLIGGARFQIDGEAFTTQAPPLSGSFGWSGLALGPHTLHVELLSPSQVPWTHTGAAKQVAITSDIDSDGDGMPNLSDNCSRIANATQLDSGGILTNQADGIGDACQCGDVDDSGIVDAADVTRLLDQRDRRIALLEAEVARLSNAGDGINPTAPAAARESRGRRPGP